MFVEREISDQALLPEAAQLAHAQVCVLLLPSVECGSPDAELPADIPTRVPASTCRSASATRSSENFDRFMGPTRSWWPAEAVTLL